MPEIPGLPAQIFFGDIEKPLPEWTARDADMEQDDDDDDDDENLSKEDMAALKSMLGFDPDDLFLENHEEVMENHDSEENLEFHPNRFLGVHQGFQKDLSGSYLPELHRSDVINGIANQYERLANPGDKNRRSPDRMVSSDKFYLMKVPVDMAVPSKRVKAGNRSYSQGPIVIDRNIRGVGKRLEQLGYDPAIMILDGKHRHAESLRNGDRQMFAYVGDQVMDRVQSRIHAERQSAARRFERLQSIIPNEIKEADPNDDRMCIGMELPKEVAQTLPLFLGRESGDPVGAHVTLVYIGTKKDVDPNQIAIIEETCSYIASQTDRLRGQIAGTHRFPESKHTDGKEVAYAGVNVDGLKEMRQNLVDLLDLYDIPYSKDFSTYVPHVTLEYVEKGEETPDLNFDPVFVKFDSLYMSQGKDLKHYYFK